MRILNAIWFAEMGKSQPIGVVIVEVEGEEHAYIGTTKSYDHTSYTDTELHEAEWITFHRM